MVDLTNSNLGPFILSHQLGEGAFGQVWMGQAKRSNGERVAIKILSDQLFSDPWALAAYERELRSTSKLYHENIGMLYDYGDLSNIQASPTLRTHFGQKAPFLVMELIDGQTLRQCQESLNWSEMAQIITQLLNGLAHAHARGVIHRDLKPSNIMVCSDEASGGRFLRCKLVDFGLAIHPHQPASNSEELIGTPPYMAPEQWEADTRRQGPWTDLYALGCVIWSMVSGNPPYGRGDAALIRHRHLHEPLPPLLPLLEIPDGLEPWLCMLLSKELSLRYASAADSLSDFIAIKGRRKVTYRPQQTPLSNSVDPTVKISRLSSECRPQQQKKPLSSRAFADAPDLSFQTPFYPQPHYFGVNLIDVRGTPMIGRESLKSALWSDFRTVSENGVMLVRLSGDSGVGLSRVLEWFSETVEETGAGLVFSLGGSDDERDPFASIFRRQFRLQGLGVADCLAQLQDRISFHFLLSERWNQAAKWLSIEEEAFFANPEEKYQLAVDLMLAAAKSQSRTLKRAVLAIDNPRCSVVMQSFYRWLLASEKKRAWPLFTLMCSKNDVATLAADVIEHRIQPMSDSDLREMIHRMMALAPELSAELVEKTSGSPKIAREALRDLVRQKALIPGPQGYCLKPGLTVKIPSSFSQIWRERLAEFLKDRSDVDAEALELAATFGQVVRIDEYERAANALRLNAGDALRDLFRYRLANLDEEIGAYRFRHPTLVQLLIESSKNNARVEKLNRICASVLDEMGDDRSKDRLGLHLIRAGNVQEGLICQLEFINRYGDTFSRMEIDRRFDEMHRQISELNLSENHYLWQRYHYNDETRQYHQNNIKGVLEIQEWLDKNLSDPLLRGRFLQHRCYALSLTDADPQCIPDLVQEGLSIATELKSDMLSEVFLRVQFDLVSASPSDWIDVLQRAQKLLSNGKGLQPMAHWFWTRAWARLHHCNLDLEKALDMNFRSLEIARERGILTQVSYAHQHLAELLTDLGRYQEAYTHAEKAAQLVVKANPREWHAPRLMMGDLSFRMGRRLVGLEQMQTALDGALSSGYARFIRFALIKLMRSYAEMSDWSGIQQHIEALTERVDRKPWSEFGDFVDMKSLVLITLRDGPLELGKALHTLLEQGWLNSASRPLLQQIAERHGLHET